MAQIPRSLHIETKKARKRYDESLVGKDDGVDELMDVEFTLP
jgi:hypothetical protein